MPYLAAIEMRLARSAPVLAEDVGATSVAAGTTGIASVPLWPHPAGLFEDKR